MMQFFNQMKGGTKNLKAILNDFKSLAVYTLNHKRLNLPTKTRVSFLLGQIISLIRSSD